MSLAKKIVWLPYDMDTANGTDNTGALVFSYNLEDIDTMLGEEAFFSGNPLWNNVRDAFGDEIAEMYKTLRSQGILSYANIEKMFEDHQAVWPEALVNEDSQFKYLDPLIQEDDGSYLGMLQGLKTEQRKWWLYNRFKYMDSKFVAGDAASDSIMIRPFAAANISVTPYADIYATVKWDNTITQQRTAKGDTATLICPYSTMHNNIVNIYSASQLASIGDLSPLKLGYADFHLATRLQEIKLGDADSEYENEELYSLTFGANVLLKKIDVRNCSGLGDTSQEGHLQTAVDVSNCPILEEVYFEGTKIQGLTLPNGGMLKKLHLPSTITNLTILNQSRITEFSIANNDYSNINTLRIENCSSAIPVNDILEDIAASSRVRLIGFTMEVESTSDVEDFYDYLDTMRGLDESGGNLDHAVVQGTITCLGTITGAWYAEMLARYPYITIEYEHISSSVYFYNGSTLLDTVSVNDGGDATYSGTTPTKTQDAQYTYSFAGWSKSNNNVVDADALKHVEADRNVYACFTGTVRTYTVTFVKASDDGGGTLQTLSNKAYGTQIKASDYTGSTPTTSKGSATDYPFLGWNPSLPVTVTGATTITAVFGSPVVVEEITDSWDAIIANIDNGTYKTKYKIGNYKPLDLGTEGTINMQIAGIDADVDVNGDAVPLTFIGMELLASTYNFSGTNNTKWDTSDLRTTLNSTFLNTIPSNVKARIIPVLKYEGGYSGIHVDEYSSYDSIWLPSGREIGKANSYETHGVDYTVLFNSDERRVKELNGTASAWITRTRYYNGFSSGTAVRANGSVNTDYRQWTEHTTIGFCLGYEPETITDDWATILAESSPSTKYSIGDTKYLDLGTEGKQLMEIVAFDTDDKADGSGKAKITWVSRMLLPTTVMFNNSDKTYNGVTGGCAGGWFRSDMRSYLKSEIFPMIPSSVRSAIVEVNKISSVPTSTAWEPDYETQAEDIWIPSTYEFEVYSSIVGETGYRYSGARVSRSCYNKNIRVHSRTAYMKTYSLDLYGTTISDKYNNAYLMIGFCTD